MSYVRDCTTELIVGARVLYRENSNTPSSSNSFREIQGLPLREIESTGCPGDGGQERDSSRANNERSNIPSLTEVMQQTFTVRNRERKRESRGGKKKRTEGNFSPVGWVKDGSRVTLRMVYGRVVAAASLG